MDKPKDLPPWIARPIHKKHFAWYLCRENGEYNEYRQLRNEVRKAILKFYIDAKRALLIEHSRARFFTYVNTRLCKSRSSRLRYLIRNFVKISPLVRRLVTAAVMRADRV